MSKIKGSRVAVVGATGFIGSHLVERLVDAGAQVLAIALSEGRRNNLRAVHDRYVFAACDIVASPGLTDVFRSFQPSIVFHLASRADGAESYEHMEACLKVNAIGTLRVLEASHAAGVQRFVYGGSSKIYGSHQVPSRSHTPADPLSSYAIGKSTGWQLCKLYSVMSQMAVTAVQPSFIYGPRQSWNLIRYVQDCVAKKQPVRLQGGEQTRDPLFVADAVGAYIAAATRPGAAAQSIPIGGGQELPVSELTRKILAAMGESDWPVELGGQPPRATEIWRNYTDNTDAKRLLNWSPEIGLEQGLRFTLAGSSWPGQTLETAAGAERRAE